MDISEFKRNAHELVEYIAKYYEEIEKYPVKSPVAPNEILSRLPTSAPGRSESFDAIMKDFNDIIMPGMTHWQHPSFFGYFPANGSLPSLLGEMLTAAMGAQCMSWATSPAASELEERVMEWLRDMTGLPSNFTGVIEDTASTSTLTSILTAREKFSNYNINESGFSRGENIQFTAYCSSECHSSIEKAVKIAGLGKDNLRKIGVDKNFAADAAMLETAIKKDIFDGKKPLIVVAGIGTTGSTAVDPLEKIGEICQKYNIWLHVDAAYAGTAMLLPELRHMIKGVEMADTLVFNPHKWMFTNFDCSAYFVKDREALIRTFEILPEYLKTPEKERVNNYRDWGVQLGRRFRALKLWFVIRSFGTEGLREKVRSHINLAQYFADRLSKNGNFEILAPHPFALVCFRYKPAGVTGEEKINAINEKVMNDLNKTGKLFLSHTKLNGNFAIRFCCSQTNVEKRHIDAAADLIIAECAKQ
ncbi:MAG TPA: aminotransferase class I/II-fold pyridoxal phosphate-dependent enzyme [Candidatus Wallbacteria bacterium]|nr:aminotransferase class I/II-fold pyridoxal phosphate-dependent enzyme [Candidatus Wallbacteria bacterium]